MRFRSRLTGYGSGVLAAAGLAAAYIQYRTARAPREHPPLGRFIEVDGARLHYLERGSGPAIVLLHGTGTMIQDFELSGLIDRLSAHHHVIAFDRPGHGYSGRPRTATPWTPERQAALLNRALARFELERPLVVAHSWATLVAVAMALEQPERYRGLVLMSGYYYPTARLDAPALAPPALPVVGGLMRHTLSPLLARVLWPRMLERLFRPARVPQAMSRFPIWLALRPAQLRAAAAEFALLLPAAKRLSQRYRQLALPVTLIHGAGDHHVEAYAQSQRLHRELRGSELELLPGIGHMPHHSAPSSVVDAIERAAGAIRPRGSADRGAVEAGRRSH